MEMPSSEDKVIFYGLISERLKKYFDSAIRGRGEDYLRANKVSPPRVGQHEAVLQIRGTKNYRVEMNWSRAVSENEFFISCSCPHYQDREICKHCWAGLLKLDQLGIGQKIRTLPDVLLQHSENVRSDDLNNQPEEDDFDEDNDADEEGDFHVYEPVKPKAWLSQLKSIQGAPVRQSPVRSHSARNSRVGYYALDVFKTRQSGDIWIEFWHQEILRSGQLGAIKHQRVSREDFALYTDPVDREIMAMLLGSGGAGQSYFYGYSAQNFSNASISSVLQDDLLRRMAKTGRFFIPSSDQIGEKTSLSFDEGKPWTLELAVIEVKDFYRIEGFLRRDAERADLHEPVLCLRSGTVIFKDRVAKLNARHHFGWIKSLREGEFSVVSKKDGDEFVQEILNDPRSPPVSWPESLLWEQQFLAPQPKVVFESPLRGTHQPKLFLDLRFIYGKHEISNLNLAPTLFDPTVRRVILRDFEREKVFSEKIKGLLGVGDAASKHEELFSFEVSMDAFPEVVAQFLAWDWKVEASGKQVRPASTVQIKISAGVDWFDLNGSATFPDGMNISLSTLASALERREHLIPLGDGTLGMLPTDWLKRYAPLSLLGESTGEGFRFQRAQGGLLGAWLAEDESMRADPDFSKLLQEIQWNSKLSPSDPEKSFQAKLRPYQKEGLGWLEFLRRTEFGGILADDMGLGKTVQVLAHLDKEGVRLLGKDRRPSLVILPKSLMFNWREEAHRFAPDLRVLSYEGPDRGKLLAEISQNDLILVTYTVLRQDIERFRSVDFHYVIADEAQSIKNRDSLTHKACCLVRGRHRLAMTGTPVENSVHDLFALLDFVTPGLLGKSLQNRVSQASSWDGLSRALRPFILRRTKDQVLKDLPEKTEKILHCELSASEMRQYEGLKKYYRSHLKGEIEKRGFAQSKIIVLEALLRLRQAACHPGLVDKRLLTAESAKVETLVARLKEIDSEGHKALVFSQFTSLLDIVEAALNREKISFERLDGKTKMEDRRLRVSRFQEDARLKVFLISLKAGGVGLNLTAADYVFILDPWWNPAVESQAIDRAHRIGQKNKVIAYRLIAKDTVEEKILDLQKSKRELAHAIVSANTGLLKKLTAEDLELLLS